MYLRMVEATVKEEENLSLENLYTEIILKVLGKTDGCIFAGLLQHRDKPRKYISLTLWSSKTDADAYVQSGDYNKNVETVQHTLEEGNEWKIQLTRNNTVEYSPVQSTPTVTSYPVADRLDSLPPHIAEKSSHLRILSLKVNKGDKNEFSRIYNTEILPALKNVNGCRYAFLLDNFEQNEEMISLTVWDDIASIEHYEQGGTFDGFMKKLGPTLGELYQWKMALESQSSSLKTVTSQDIGISKFRMITGKNFG